MHNSLVLLDSFCQPHILKVLIAAPNGNGKSSTTPNRTTVLPLSSLYEPVNDVSLVILPLMDDVQPCWNEDNGVEGKFYSVLLR
jgi:hypothetical protein